MKRAKKLIALLTAVTIMLTTVLTATAAEDYGELKVSNKQFSTVGGYITSEYPQIDGMSDLNKKIEDAVNSFYGKHHGELLDQINGIIINTKVTDEHARYSKLEVLISLYWDPNEVGAETYTYYIDKSEYKEISESEYKDGLEAVEDEEEEEETEEEEEVVESELSDEILATMVPLRSNLESLGFEIGWNAELAAVEVYVDSELAAILFIGEDLYVVGDVVVELGIAPELIDGVTNVPVIFFSEIVGADVLVDEDGNISFAAPEEAQEEVTEEAPEE